MDLGYLSAFPLHAKGFIKGRLEQTQEGQVVLKTGQRVIPVKLDGESAPFGQETVFRLLREEPGLIVLAPYRSETIGEALPFFKQLFAGDEDFGRKLLRAAVQESLPLTREVLSNLKRGITIAKRQWGVQVHPRAIAFLQARAIPLTPRSLLAALYTLFPSVQKTMWQKAGRGLIMNSKMTEGMGLPLSTPEQRAEEKIPDATKKPGLEPVLREAITFLQCEARRDATLPHFIFCLFPTAEREARWEGRYFSDREKSEEQVERGASGESYAFRLLYQSPCLGQLEVIGVNNQSGLKLTVKADRSVLDNHLFAGFQSYLEEKGWPIQAVQFEESQAEEDVDLHPLRIDGWL